MSKKAMTVLGPIDAEDMGVTSSHEHMILGMPGWEFEADYTYDRRKSADLCISVIRKAQEYGLQSIVDASPMDLGRDPELYKILQKETGVNILCSTGMYTEGEGNSAFWRLALNYRGYDETLQRLARAYRNEIVNGIKGTDVRCGVIKVSVGGKEISKFEEMSVHAGAIVQKELGTPIISHTGSPERGPELARLLLEKGADPERSMIGHMCDTDDLDLLVSCLDMGFYIGLDRFGLNAFFNDMKKCENLVKMVNMGYEDRILIGHDASVHNLVMDMMPADVMNAMKDWNLCGLFRTFIPRMKELGLSDRQVEKLLKDNPQRFFAYL